MNREKLLSVQKENVRVCTLKQEIQKESVAKTTKKLTEVKADKNYLNGYILDDWDNWYPDPS